MKHLLLRSLLVLGLLFGASTPLYCADLSITAASFVPGANAKYLYATAGAAITIGQPIYLDASDSNKAKAADADDTAKINVVGLAANTTTAAGQIVAYLVEDDDLTLGATLSMSAPIYVLSSTAGGIAPSADISVGEYPIILLVAKSTTKCILKPRVLRGTAAAVAP